MAAPTGRGFYCWHVAKCEGGDLSKIVQKCKDAGVSWLAVKAGDQGRPWTQFSKELVDTLHAGGVQVFGWSYDVPTTYKDVLGRTISNPGVLRKQAVVIKRVADMGADGFIIDAESEWDRAIHPDDEATAYGKEVASLGLSKDFLVGDAPWPLVSYHASFPFTAFGKWVAFRTPQVYWTAMKLDKNHKVVGPVDDSCERYAFSWDTYETWVKHGRKPPAPEAVCPHLPGGSAFTDGRCVVKPSELAYFEAFAAARGNPGVLYWVWDACPEDIWTALVSKTVPEYGTK